MPAPSKGFFQGGGEWVRLRRTLPEMHGPLNRRRSRGLRFGETSETEGSAVVASAPRCKAGTFELEFFKGGGGR